MGSRKINLASKTVIAFPAVSRLKKVSLSFAVLVAVLSLQAGPSLGFTYSGDLTTATVNSEIDGVGEWITPGPTSIHWEVTDNGSSWHYKYVLTVPGEHEVSHFIIEVSDTFGPGDFDYTGYPTSIGDYHQGNGNPDIPGVLHGLKFDETSGTTLVVEFDSLRVPVWGDFYAKDGGNPTIQAWNEGFVDADPLDPGSQREHQQSYSGTRYLCARTGYSGCAAGVCFGFGNIETQTANLSFPGCVD